MSTQTGDEVPLPLFLQNSLGFWHGKRIFQWHPVTTSPRIWWDICQGKLLGLKSDFAASSGSFQGGEVFQFGPDSLYVCFFILYRREPSTTIFRDLDRKITLIVAALSVVDFLQNWRGDNATSLMNFTYVIQSGYFHHKWYGSFTSP